MPSKKLKFHRIYPFNEIQLEALRKYLDENLKKDYIKLSISPIEYLILFVPKKNGELRLYVDYRQLNDIIIKDRTLLPLIIELRDWTYWARWFILVDLKRIYNLLRVKEGDEWKTVFRIRLGYYEYLVMPFGLTNVPAIFQTIINDMLQEHLDKFVVVYLDNILIYSEILEEYRKHVHTVLQALERANLLVELKKCEFHKQTVRFLGYEISLGQVRIDPAKIQTIKEWIEPKMVKEV
jgi:hypothetical protein